MSTEATQSTEATKGSPGVAESTNAAGNQPAQPDNRQEKPDSPKEKTGAERREFPRRSFTFAQKIAPVVEGKLPDRANFFEVQCRDISASGLAFIMPSPPDFDTLVVALGSGAKVNYLVAKVARVNRIEEEGQTFHRVGCFYVGRADY